MTATHAEPAVRGPNTLDHKIGLKVRSRRLEIGMSQERLAEKLGVTFQQIQKYEKGVNRIAASRLFAVAKALDVTVAFFFPPSGVEDAPSEFDRMASDAGGLTLARHWNSMSEPMRRRTVALVEAIAGDDPSKKAGDL